MVCQGRGAEQVEHVGCTPRVESTIVFNCLKAGRTPCVESAVGFVSTTVLKTPLFQAIGFKLKFTPRPPYSEEYKKLKEERSQVLWKAKLRGLFPLRYSRTFEPPSLESIPIRRLVDGIIRPRP